MTTTQSITRPTVGAVVHVRPAVRDDEAGDYAQVATVATHHGDAIDLRIAYELTRDGRPFSLRAGETWTLYDSEQAAGLWMVTVP